MFESAIAINEFQIGGFEKIVADLPESDLFVPGAGHGHPPAWIMGHLAVAGESGLIAFGRTPSHPTWTSLFGPQSSDRISFDPSLTKPILSEAVIETYRNLRELASTADPELMARRHRVPLFYGTSIRTVGDCLTLLLTNHFGFHLSQLSSCRRAAGFSPLF